MQNLYRNIFTGDVVSVINMGEKYVDYEKIKPVFLIKSIDQRKATLKERAFYEFTKPFDSFLKSYVKC